MLKTKTSHLQTAYDENIYAYMLNSEYANMSIYIFHQQIYWFLSHSSGLVSIYDITDNIIYARWFERCIFESIAASNAKYSAPPQTDMFTIVNLHNYCATTQDKFEQIMNMSNISGTYKTVDHLKYGNIQNIFS